MRNYFRQNSVSTCNIGAQNALSRVAKRSVRNAKLRGAPNKAPSIMSSKSKKNVASKSNKGASKAPAVSEGRNKWAPAIGAAMRLVFAKRREHMGAMARTTKIELALLKFAPSKEKALSVREIETILGAEVKCVRNHIMSLYHRALIARRDDGAFYCKSHTLKGAKLTVASDNEELGALKTKTIFVGAK